MVLRLFDIGYDEIDFDVKQRKDDSASTKKNLLSIYKCFKLSMLYYLNDEHDFIELLSKKIVFQNCYSLGYLAHAFKCFLLSR